MLLLLFHPCFSSVLSDASSGLLTFILYTGRERPPQSDSSMPPYTILLLGSRARSDCTRGVRRSTEQSSPHCAHLHLQMHIHPTKRHPWRKLPTVTPFFIAQIETRAQSHVSMSMVFWVFLQHHVPPSRRIPIKQLRCAGLGYDVHSRAMHSKR